METKVTFSPGDIIMKEGDVGEHAYIIEKGLVKITFDKDGEEVSVGERGPGSLIGEMALIDQMPRTATVTAVEQCEMIAINNRDFTSRISGADPVLKMIIRVVMARYRDTLRRWPHISKSDQSGNPSAESIQNADSSHAEAIENIKITNELSNALKNGELKLVYQPIVSFKTGEISGFESLMRWHHPEKGIISPGVFIPVAEQSGLIVDMTRWALEHACIKLQDFDNHLATRQDPDPLFISVNFSSRDFENNNLPNEISDIVGRTGIDPKRIHIEITESLLMLHPQEAQSILQKCRDSGIKVSIDDFGTGYSSLSYLHSFPIDCLKIDQFFIKEMLSQGNRSLELVKSILALAKNMKLTVIAEGVEGETEAKLLRSLNCDFAQGFWYAKPIAEEDVAQTLETWKPVKLPFQMFVD